MEMMPGRREDVEAGLVGENGKLAQVVEHLLIALVVAPNWPQALAVLEGRGHRGQHEKHELHRSPPPALLELTLCDSSLLRSVHPPCPACEAPGMANFFPIKSSPRWRCRRGPAAWRRLFGRAAPR